MQEKEVVRRARGGLTELGRPLLLAVLALASSCTGGASSPVGAPHELTLEVGGLEEVEQALAARRGQACLLNFWATWCPPCVAELPDLVEVAREFRPRGVSVMGVSYDLMQPDVSPEDALSKVRAFLDARKFTLPTVVLEPSDFDALDERFQLPGVIPVTLAFDKNGKIVDRHEGEASRERFVSMTRRALGE